VGGVEVGLLHLHRTLGYLLFVVALVDLVLVITKARSDARLAGILSKVHTFGMMGAGRLNLVIGITLLVTGQTYPIATWWAWAGLALWVPIEIVAKRLIKPEIAVAVDGGTASGRLALGAAIELLCIVAIFGLMSARP